MDEPSHGPQHVKVDGTAALCWEWPQASGPSLLWLRPRDPSAPLTPAAVVALARTRPGQVVATEDLDVSAAMADAGLPLVRHVHAMNADPAVVVRASVRDDLRMAPQTDATLEQLAEIRISAFAPGHPDHMPESREQRIEAYARELADPSNPVLAASRSAWLGDELVGTCLVVDSRHFPGFVGPWVQSVARRPGEDARGVGAALLVASAQAVLDDGGDHLGLAVTDSNPARLLYERLGWTGPQMWLHRVSD